MNLKNNLKIVNVDIDLLKSSSYNPRIWNEKAIADLTASIKKFGVCDPILVNSAPNRRNIILGGHMRMKILRDLKYKTVPVIYLNIPDLKTEKELNLRLNKNTGAFNYELLKNFEIDQLLEIGFDDYELSSIWDDQVSVENDDFDYEKELNKIKKTNIKPGDLFQLENHRLLCADSSNLENVKKLVGNEKIDIIYQDSPYNINLNYKGGIGTKNKYSNSSFNDNKNDEDYEKFLKQILKNGLAVAKPDCHVFEYCDPGYVGMVQKIYKDLGIKYQRTCLWIKNNSLPTPQIAFNRCYESCIYGTVNDPYLSKIKNFTEIMNKEVDSGNRTIDDILDLIDIWMCKRDATSLYEHPTQKPVTLHERAIKRCTKPGDHLLDLFGGSGSALLCCEQLGRKAYLCEIDPIFCQLILNRFKQFTGKNYEKIN